MNKLIKISLALSVTTAIGCASAPMQPSPIQSDADIDVAAWDATAQEYGEGVVLLSTHISKSCNAYATDFILKKFMPSTQAFEIQDAVFLNQKQTSSQFDEYYGHVYQLDLEAGIYELSLDSTSPLFEYEDESLATRFILKSDEVKYLGEVQLMNCSEAGFVVQNNWESVAPVFQQVFPDIETNEVTVDTLKVEVPVASL